MYVFISSFTLYYPFFTLLPFLLLLINSQQYVWLSFIYSNTYLFITRLEMQPFGVKVSLIEPGNYANGTHLFAMDEQVDKEVSSMWSGLSDELKADYGEDFCRQVKGFMKNFRRKGERDINPVINAFTEALTQQHPQARYCPMTPLTLFVALVSTHLPEWFYDGLLSVLALLLLKKEDM
ncbi:D-beta-hydroxybutyrate dehydrogenase, mitochondrial [Chionoecetes opilio]|uniref:D-beta-hydroxybutyrate dehydrogenase, mitochondrial n=1 Tax=Chionoecetes opilio TaxID=41210 RepID=A0A8J4Y4Q8_CHIOP|nr:D-beta-hydroxybutyrate dehydrogenase, mitochondrial [Chionoecetes opilio]